ncbi:MAG TPA: hypothetical protein VEU55_05155 [Gemmatimonadales bacterium]|nr:hypothetical protein [Gemmatimonadales bacterium]
MRASSLALVPVALALSLGGCHRRAAPPLNPQAEIALTVENQNFSDMDIFIVRRGGERIRIGMVPGLSSRLFMVRPDVIGYSSDVQFEVHPIGGRANPISETMPVQPGDVIHLTIPPS